MRDIQLDEHNDILAVKSFSLPLTRSNKFCYVAYTLWQDIRITPYFIMHTVLPLLKVKLQTVVATTRSYNEETMIRGGRAIASVLSDSGS